MRDKLSWVRSNKLRHYKRDQTLAVHLAHSLSDAAWMQLLDECEHHNVQLSLSIAQNVQLPSACSALSINPLPKLPAQVYTTFPMDKVSYCQSNDCEVTLDTCKNRLIIDVTEVSSANLLGKIDAHFDANREDDAFLFEHQEGLLIDALNQGKQVVLTGELSTECIQKLSAFIHQRQHDAGAKGQLTFVSHALNPFPLIPNYEHYVGIPDKRKALGVHAFNDAQLAQYSLAQLRAIQLHKTPDEPWIGMLTLPPLSIAPLDLTQLDEQVRAFNEKRLHDVQAGLKRAPFVFLAGPTGCGKTTFVHDILKPGYTGEAQLHEWAADQTAGQKIIFIDEANITSRQWSEFEGLFQDPPFIILQNKRIPLTKEHKVLFAGNPLSYGGERQLPSLFKRHGGSVLFEPLSQAYITHQILLPALTGKLDKGVFNEVLTPILNVATYLTMLSTTAVLITPRELGMIALLTANYCRLYPKAAPAEVARYYAYYLARQFVPDAQRLTFDAQFKANLPLQSGALKPDKLLINNTNQLAFQTITDFLNLRKSRREETTNNSIQAYGGLGGVILEGEPGSGKSELVIQTLRAQNLKEGLDFYRLCVNMPLAEAEELLLKAFHEGRIVIIDEINAAPTMERLLNDLLMGNSPDGKKPEKPGFMIIGTQNPATMGGRQKASQALCHRLQTIILPEYSATEMQDILIAEKLPASIAKDMVNDYIQQKKHIHGVSVIS